MTLLFGGFIFTDAMLVQWAVRKRMTVSDPLMAWDVINDYFKPKIGYRTFIPVALAGLGVNMWVTQRQYDFEATPQKFPEFKQGETERKIRECFRKDGIRLNVGFTTVTDPYMKGV
jgi:hypothetical protein